MRFWISWKEYAPDNRPLTDPPSEAILGWWESGAGDGFTTLCAVVEAGTEWEARKQVLKNWPAEGPPRSTRWRFIEPKPDGWTPGDRFPIKPGSWSAKRFGV
jgi:hypothetical protein